MGLLSKAIKERPKFDIPFTVVEIISIRDSRTTTIKIIDDVYSIKGVVVKTIELPTFEDEFGDLYNYYVKYYLDLALKVENYIRAGRIY